jgi:hypothetical protein
MAAYGGRFEIALKCRFAHAVDNQICPPPVRDPLYFSHEILLCVDDDVVSAGRARRARFRLSRDSELLIPGGGGVRVTERKCPSWRF